MAASFKLNAVQQQLVVDNIALAYHVARGFKRTGLKLENDTDTAISGLCKAAYKFDENNGNKFTTFAVWVMKNAIITAIKSERVHTLPVAPFAEVNNHGRDDWGAEQADWQRHQRHQLLTALRALTPAQREIARLWLRGLSLPKIAKRINAEYCTVRRYHRQALERMRQSLSAVYSG